MAAKYMYYLILGFIPQYTNRDRNAVSYISSKEESDDELTALFGEMRVKFPVTNKVVDFDENTSLYCLKYNRVNLVYLLRSTRPRDAVKAYDSLRYLLALVYQIYQDELDLVPLSKKPNFSTCTSTELFELVRPFRIGLDSMIFNMELGTGAGVAERQVSEINIQLLKAYNGEDIRKALACFYQSQFIYYTHLVESYVVHHSRPDLIDMSRDEITEYNYLYKEMLYCSLLTCYRGIEAIYSKNFRTKDFQGVKKNQLESLMRIKIPNADPQSKYHLRFYRQRDSNPPRNKLIITMLQIFFRARNRAAHGNIWKRAYKEETFGKDLVDEAKFFLRHLVISLLW